MSWRDRWRRPLVKQSRRVFSVLLHPPFAKTRAIIDDLKNDASQNNISRRNNGSIIEEERILEGSRRRPWTYLNKHFAESASFLSVETRKHTRLPYASRRSPSPEFFCVGQVLRISVHIAVEQLNEEGLCASAAELRTSCYSISGRPSSVDTFLMQVCTVDQWYLKERGDIAK